MGTLYIVATPIGNLEDITIRAIKTILTVPVIACEDTRRTGQLLKHLRDQYSSMVQTIEPFKQKLISYYDEVEENKAPGIIQLLGDGNDVALVSDAGTPLISDPGFRLVRACKEKHIPVVPIPGPSSVITALSASGLPPDQFLFLGYLPKKETKRKTLLSTIKSLWANSEALTPTVILFVPSHDYQQTLADIRDVLGDCTVVRAKELTKVHEAVEAFTLQEVIAENHTPHGEYILLLSKEKRSV